MPWVDPALVVHRLARDWSLPFFKAIKKGKEFEWTPDCEQSFQVLKKYLQSSQLLTRPVVGDVLQLYLAVSEFALSSFLIREEAKVQSPAYYLATVGYETLPEALVVEWVEEEAFRTKEVMRNDVLEGEGGSPAAWYQDVLDYLRTTVLHGDPSVANKIRR
ncbi:hypothetical protein LIER_21496 [Lithospermum erythrorhizon]|uniref:Reverse transcriptase/retrotransposon-derived protein RNase H-like domain-containing protein n=1 Tax=Lithospermum erythrorhizon TaxID=34254 RepID=A0AAV3QTD3_LITER